MADNPVRVHVLQNAEECARYALVAVSGQIREAVAARGRCIIALAGGSTPKRLYALLADLPAGEIPWSQVILLWGDERDVPPEHADSNYRMVREALLDHLSPDRQPQCHRIPVGSQSPVEAADSYEQVLRSLARDAAGLKIDVLLLGIGDDSHTASLFPGTAALRTVDRAVAANWVEKLNTWRVTLTYPQLNNAADVYFLVCGESKRQALRNIWDGPRDIDRFPAQGVQPLHGRVHWLIDRAAAEGLEETIERINAA